MALWSKAAFDVLQVPLGHVATFIAQHGLLRLDEQPQWRVIRSGATQYLEAFERQFKARSNCKRRYDKFSGQMVCAGENR